MKIQTGRGTIPLLTLIGIWSISALTSLPGLGVSPILGKLAEVFPTASDLEVQMLTSLPSLLIIPFTLLAGKLTEKNNYVGILLTGLIIFTASGVLYMLSDKMWMLIAVSALLGIGAGIIIPLSTGLISRFFVGKYRVKQFGLSSAITNVTLVIATFVTGVLADLKNWHWPFIVYLLPVFSILLSYWLRSSINKKQGVTTVLDDPADKVVIPDDLAKSKHGINVKHLGSIMGLYGIITYIVIIVSFNLPFLMQSYGYDSGHSGFMISLFFLAIMAPGFFLNYILKFLKGKVIIFNLIIIAVGLFLVWVFHAEWIIAIGCICMGLGYGIIQPLLYEKTTLSAIPQKSTLALGFMMAMNYVAILLCPFIVDLFELIFHTKSEHFPFVFNLVLTGILIAIAVVRHKTFLFTDINKQSSLD